MRKSIKSLPIILLLTSLVPNLALAALVTVNVSGSITTSPGDYFYSIEGSTFTVNAVYDTSIADRQSDPTLGFFNDQIGETALVSFELSTDLGSVNFQTANLIEPTQAPHVTQSESAGQQKVSTIYNASLSPTPKNGFTSTMQDFVPDALVFGLTGIGSNDYFFTDPNELFSGIGNFSTVASFLGGSVNLTDYTTPGQATISFGSAAEISISAVPVPAAAWLFCSGLIGLVGFARRKKA